MRRSHYSQLRRVLVATTVPLLVFATTVNQSVSAQSPSPQDDSLGLVHTMNSVSALQALVAESKEQEELIKHVISVARRKGDSEKPAVERMLHKGYEPDWYAARLSYIRQRAYPNDTIDTAAYQKAIAQRQKLAPAVINGTTTAPTGVAKGVNALGAPALVGTTTIGRGTMWEFVGPKKLDVPYTTYYGPEGSDTSGRVNGLAFDPTNPNIAYLASAGGGVWKTVNGGAQWTPLGDGFSYLQTSAIAVSAKDPQIVLAGLGDYDGFLSDSSQGIMRSTDGGKTWQNVGAAQMAAASVSAILFDPDKPDVVIATTGRGARASSGIFRSTDAGKTWTRIIPVGQTASTVAYWSDVKAGVPDAAKKRYLYAAVEDSATSGKQGVYRSEDNGVTWSQITLPITTGYGLRVAPSATDPYTVYFVSAATQKIYKGVKPATSETYTWTDITGTDTTDSSQTNWTGYNWSQATYDLHMTCAAQVVNGAVGDVLYFGGISIAANKGGGTQWNNFGRTYYDDAKTHNDQHCMAIYPKDPNIMLVGNDGGVYRVDYDSASANSWKIQTNLSATLGITQFYSGDWSTTNANVIIGGTQDNATPQVRFALTDWNNVGGGDGAGVGINPTNNLVQYASVYGGGVYRTTDGFARNGGDYISPLRYTGLVDIFSKDYLPFTPQIAVDPTYPHPMYFGTDYLWRWTEDGVASVTNPRWEGRIGGTQLSPGGQVESIAIAPSDPKRLYVGTTEGFVWMSADKGASWKKIVDPAATGTPKRVVKGISIHPTKPNDILFVYSGTGTNHVWRCTDTNAAAPAFAALDKAVGTAQGLPDIPVNCVERMPGQLDNTFFVGTDLGVFQYKVDTKTWYDATAPLGLPNIIVNSIKATPRTAYLNVATYGRGIWRYRIADLQATKATASN